MKLLDSPPSLHAGCAGGVGSGARVCMRRAAVATGRHGSAAQCDGTAKSSSTGGVQSESVKGKGHKTWVWQETAGQLSPTLDQTGRNLIDGHTAKRDPPWTAPGWHQLLSPRCLSVPGAVKKLLVSSHALNDCPCSWALERAADWEQACAQWDGCACAAGCVIRALPTPEQVSSTGGRRKRSRPPLWLAGLRPCCDHALLSRRARAFRLTSQCWTQESVQLLQKAGAEDTAGYEGMASPAALTQRALADKGAMMGPSSAMLFTELATVNAAVITTSRPLPANGSQAACHGCCC